MTESKALFESSQVCAKVIVSCFFRASATTRFYTLSLHDALPISHPARRDPGPAGTRALPAPAAHRRRARPAPAAAAALTPANAGSRSEEHTSELQSHDNLV